MYEVRRLRHEDVLHDGNTVGVEGRRIVYRSSGPGRVVLGLWGEEELRPFRLVVVLSFGENVQNRYFSLNVEDKYKKFP